MIKSATAGVPDDAHIVELRGVGLERRRESVKNMIEYEQTVNAAVSTVR